MITVLTNVDRDHLVNYDGSFSKLREAFLGLSIQLAVLCGCSSRVWMIQLLRRCCLKLLAQYHLRVLRERRCAC